MTNMAKCAYRGVCMATGANQVRVLASWHAEATSADTNKQTQNPWLLSANSPTVQTPCKDSIAFQNASLCGEGASDATIMPPAPSDHYMREATTALRTVSATLGPQLSVDVEVLRALSGPARRNG